MQNYIYVKYVELYLYKKEDYMWIGGIKCLVENIGIKQSDFINSDLFRLFECSDFQILIVKTDFGML